LEQEEEREGGGRGRKRRGEEEEEGASLGPSTLAPLWSSPLLSPALGLAILAAKVCPTLVVLVVVVVSSVSSS
jgi:hypothetical protein